MSKIKKGKSEAKQPKLSARFIDRLWIGAKAPKQGKGKSGLNLEFFCAILLLENSEAAKPLSDAALAIRMGKEFPDFARSDSDAGPRFIRGLRSNLNRGGLRAQRSSPRNMSAPSKPIPEFNSKGEAIGASEAPKRGKGKSKGEAKPSARSAAKPKRRRIKSKSKGKSEAPSAEAASA